MSEPAACAELLLQAVPAVMRAIRREVRLYRPADLSIPQFRALAYLAIHEGASLSEIADHLGLTAPSMSRLVEGLVRRHLMSRQTSRTDRRRVELSLTGEGRATFRAVRKALQSRLAQELSHLPADELSVLAAALETLLAIFTPTTHDDEGSPA